MKSMGYKLLGSEWFYPIDGVLTSLSNILDDRECDYEGSCPDYYWWGY